MDRRILANFFFDGSRNQLLHLLCLHARPRRQSDRHTHWDIGIFALRHGVVPIPAPKHGTDQKYPCDLAVLDKETGSIPAFFNHLGIALMCHGWVSQSWNMPCKSFGPSLACQVWLGSRNHPDFIAVLNQRATRDDD